jgi:hypothetical protein
MHCAQDGSLPGSKAPRETDGLLAPMYTMSGASSPRTIHTFMKYYLRPAATRLFLYSCLIINLNFVCLALNVFQIISARSDEVPLGCRSLCSGSPIHQNDINAMLIACIRCGGIMRYVPRDGTLDHA